MTEALRAQRRAGRRRRRAPWS